MAGRPSSYEPWKDRVREMAENNPRWGGRRIRTELAKAPDGNDAPSPRTIDRMLEGHRNSPADEQIGFRHVSWPESFTAGDLPWEAAPAALELLRWLHHISPPWPGPSARMDSPEWLAESNAALAHEQAVMESGISSSSRPTVSLVRWLYRVTQAAPEAPFDWRYEMAGHLAAVQGSGLSDLQEKMHRAIEARVIAGSYASVIVVFQEPRDTKGPDK